MRQSLPTGAGSLYTRKENGLLYWETMKDPTGCSRNSIEWLNFWQNQPPFFENGTRKHIIRHGENGGEKDIKIDGIDRVYKPDGYVCVNGQEHIWEFQGCRFHACPVPSCKTECVRSPAGLENDRIRLERLRKRAHKFYLIYECQWEKVKKNVVYRNFTSLFWNIDRGITEDELLQAIIDNKLFGLGKSH